MAQCWWCEVVQHRENLLTIRFSCSSGRKTPLLGIVLNRADMNSKSNMYYHRYYRSSYYYNSYGSRSQKQK